MLRLICQSSFHSCLAQSLAFVLRHFDNIKASSSESMNGEKKIQQIAYKNAYKSYDIHLMSLSGR